MEFNIKIKDLPKGARLNLQVNTEIIVSLAYSRLWRKDDGPIIPDEVKVNRFSIPAGGVQETTSDSKLKGRFLPGEHSRRRQP